MNMKRIVVALCAVFAAMLAGRAPTTFDKSGVAVDVSVSLDDGTGNHI